LQKHYTANMKRDKLKQLLWIVVEHYIDKGEPIGSKFLHSLEDTDYAPSTLRKYLNILEKEGLLYQPYNSAGRVPTKEWLSDYMDSLLAIPDGTDEYWINTIDFQVDYARNDLRSIVETLGGYMDGAVVWFLKEDEYYYLGINNLLSDNLISEVETTKYLIKFIESKQLVQELDTKMMKKWTIYYSFLETHEKLISVIYTKMEVNWFDAVVSVLWPSRVDHKKNVDVLKKFLHSFAS